MMKMFVAVALVFLASMVGSVVADPAYVPPTYSVSDNLVLRINSHIFTNAPKPPSSTPMSRCNSISFIAINDVINSIHPINKNALVTLAVRGQNKRANVRAAILGAFNATRTVCMSRLPNQYKANVLLFNEAELAPYQTALFDFVAAEVAQIDDEEDAIVRGLALGNQAAAQVLALRENDGYNVPAPIQDEECGVTGRWCSWTEKTKPADARGASYPNWGRVKPFSFASASQYTVPPPPQPGHPLFDTSLNNTRMFGQLNTPQSSKAWMDEVHAWSLGAGGELGARIADSMFKKSQLVMSDYTSAQIFGRLYIGNCDALIANLYNKYKYNAWRPYQAIRQTVDPEWLPQLTTPVNQEYPCGHCMGTSGALRAVQLTLGFDLFPLVSQSEPAALVSPGQRASPTFRSFSEVYEHVNRARLYGGMHFPFSIQEGSIYGMAISQNVYQTMFTPL